MTTTGWVAAPVATHHPLLQNWVTRAGFEPVISTLRATAPLSRRSQSAAVALVVTECQKTRPYVCGNLPSEALRMIGAVTAARWAARRDPRCANALKVSLCSEWRNAFIKWGAVTRVCSRSRQRSSAGAMREWGSSECVT
jgi:hypothetical protein